MKYLNILSFIILGSAALIIGVVTYWIIYPYNPMDIHYVHVTTPTVKAGENVEIHIKATKHISHPAKVLREIINDHAWSLPSQFSNVPPGLADWTLRVKIPENCPSGNDYQVHTTYIYQVNPIRKVEVDWITPQFQVIGKR